MAHYQSILVPIIMNMRRHKIYIIQVLFLFILTVAPCAEVLCCMGANQNRLFPLGKSTKGYVFVEAHLLRGGIESIEWYGKVFLVTYNENHEKISSDNIGEFSLSKDSYETELKKIFQDALNKSKVLPEFIEAIPRQITFCNYNKECSLADLFFGETPNEIYIELESTAKRYLVTVLNDETSIANEFLSKYGFDNGIALPKFVLINSVRRFSIADKYIAVVHIGNGHFFDNVVTGEPYPREEFSPDIKFESLNDSVFIEPVIHHGTGFDFFIIE